jgi:PEGA domain-containing protein
MPVPSVTQAVPLRPVSPAVLQPLADSPQLSPEPVRVRSARTPDPVAAAQHELSREVAAAAAASHMFGGAADANASASAPPGHGTGRTDRRRTFERIALLVLAAIAVVQSLFIAWKTDAAAFIRGGSATINIDSRPANAQVVIDGQVRGSTPISVRLNAGAHVLELRAGNEARVLPITVQANITYAQYVELPSASVKGSLEIREPAGARVLVDGRLRGTVPLRVGDLEPGAHEVVLEHRGVRSRRTVDVQPGLTATLGPGPAAAQAAATLATEPAVTSGTGWLTVKAPYEMQLLEGGRPLGTTSRERIELPAGRHVVEVVSETLGLRETRSVDVSGGKETVLTIDLPKGQLTLVATPPAEVFVDGERAGETPILNMPVAVGPHEVTFRHPEFGEEHRAVTVAAGTPARLEVRFKDAPPQQ